MKRNFHTLASKLAYSAGLLCACAVLAGPFAGCARIDELQHKVTELDRKLTDLTSQMQELDELIKSKKTIDSVTFDEQKGIYTIVFSDKSTIQVTKNDGTVPQLGVAQDENGAYYWTLDGKPMLDAKGGKLYSAPSLRVNQETGFWEVSADGGVTYHSTGIKASKNASIISKVNEDENYVYFVLADGSSIKVAKTVELSFRSLVGKQYFKAGQKRDVKLALSGVKKTAVFSKPEGWRASINGSTLTIKAPTADNSAAEESGKVIVQAWFNDGTSDIIEVNVRIGVAPHEFNIQPNMDIEITVDPTLIDNYDFGSAVGLLPLSEFSEEKVLAMYGDNYDRWMWPNAFPLRTSLKEQLGNKEPVKGETYILYVVTSEWMKGKEILYTAITVPDIKISAPEISFDNANITVEVKGFDEYYGGVRADEEGWDLAVIDDIKYGYGVTSKNSYSGPLDRFCVDEFTIPIDLRPGTSWIVYVLPKTKPSHMYDESDVKNFVSFKVTLNDLKLGGTATVEVSNVETTLTSIKATVTKKPGVYKYWVRYYKADKMAEFTTDDLLIADMMNRTPKTEETYQFEENNLKPGQKGTLVAVGIDKDGNVGPFVKKEVVTNELSFSAIEIAAPKANAGVDNAVINIPATDGIKKYKYLSMTFAEWQLHFTFKGDLAEAEKYLALQNSTNYLCTVVDANADGSAEIAIQDLAPGTRYSFIVIGEDKDGKPTHAKQVNYTPNIKSYIDNSMPNYKPLTINSVTLDGVNVKDMTVEQYSRLEVVNIEVVVTPPANCRRIIFVGGTTPEDVKAGANPAASEKGKDVTGWLLSHYSKQVQEVTGTSSVVCSYDFFNNVSHGYLVWQDNDGNYYHYQEIAPETMLSDYVAPAN